MVRDALDSDAMSSVAEEMTFPETEDSLIETFASPSFPASCRGRLDSMVLLRIADGTSVARSML